MRKSSELALKIIHHPKYFRPRRDKKPLHVDISLEQEKSLPKWLRESRRREMDALFERITAQNLNKNFTIDRGSDITTMKEYLFGDGFSLVVFDCNTPSYMVPSENDDNIASSMQIIKISSPEMK